MFKLLVAIDGSAAAQRALRHAIGLSGPQCTPELHLLNAQEPIRDWEVRRFLNEEEIEAMLAEKGRHALEEAEALVREAGRKVASSEVVVGPVPETIVEQARRKGCDQIVMGTRGMGSLQGLLLGSVSTKVLHLVEIPVLLVK